MKKKEQKKRTAQNRDVRNSELDSLNSQLGGFGLEPPKLYRQDQRQQRQAQQGQPQRGANQTRQPAKRKRANDDRPLTPDEKRKLQNKKRKQKKVIRKISYILMLIAAVVAVIIVLSLTVLFKIDTVKIVGNEKYTTKQISAVLPIGNQDNLFLADVNGAAKKIEENLPYVNEADIQRKFPSTIVVNITEAKQIYTIKNIDKTFTLLDKDFKVLEASVTKKPKGSITIYNAELKNVIAGQSAEFTDEQIEKDLQSMTKCIEDLKLEKITSISSTDINNNYIVYDGRIKYKLGTTDNIENKIYSALAATDKLNESDPDAHGEITSTGGKQVYFTEK